MRGASGSGTEETRATGTRLTAVPSGTSSVIDTLTVCVGGGDSPHPAKAREASARIANFSFIEL